MKRIFLTAVVILLPIPLFAYVSPGKSVGLMNDFAKIFTSEERQTIGAKLIALNEKTGVELAVVTIPTIGMNETIESYAEKLFKEWGIGNEKKDTGLLLLVAVSDRQMRIETGYGLEGAITDIQSGNIIRNVLTPSFKEGKYGEGISGAVDALVAIIIKSPEAAEYSTAPLRSQTQDSNTDYFALLFFGVVILNILAGILGKTKSWWLGGVIGAGIGVIIGFIWGWMPIGFGALFILVIIGLIFDYIVSKHPPKGGHGGDHDGWMMLPLLFMGGGRRGGGSFGGFGGGMSGGGGASGRW